MLGSKNAYTKIWQFYINFCVLRIFLHNVWILNNHTSTRKRFQFPTSSIKNNAWNATKIIHDKHLLHILMYTNIFLISYISKLNIFLTINYKFITFRYYLLWQLFELIDYDRKSVNQCVKNYFCLKMTSRLPLFVAFQYFKLNLKILQKFALDKLLLSQRQT